MWREVLSWASMCLYYYKGGKQVALQGITEEVTLKFMTLKSINKIVSKGWKGVKSSLFVMSVSKITRGDGLPYTRKPYHHTSPVTTSNKQVSSPFPNTYHPTTPKEPSWIPLVTNLVSVEFRYCRSIQWLPPFDQLPYLKQLTVFGLTNLEHIDVNRGSPSFFPSLTDLSLRDCPNLKGFVRCKIDVVGTNPSSISMEELPGFPCLSKLEVGGCPNLIYMPIFPKLEITSLSEDGGVKSLIEVLKMAKSSASESPSSPFSTLYQLEDLSIRYLQDCPVDELLQYLPSLKNLLFFYCKCKILSRDEEDDVVLWQNLKVLQSVDFMIMENLVSLPKGFQYVTTLRRLSFGECDNLASIPEWMRNLNVLQDLSIHYCPKLSERCKNNTAEDWPKISHIPNITIDGESIQRNGYYLL